MSSRVVFENIALFTDAPNGVTKLRELVLQLAVQGRLVQKVSNDEPSLESLKTISIGELGYEKAASRATINSEGGQQPFDLPSGWKWCRLADFGISQTGTTPATSKPEYYGTEYPFIKPADITPDGINYRKEGLSKLGLQAGRLVPALSVLMVSIGGSIGKVGIVDRECSCNQQINFITLHNKVIPKLFYYFLRSPYFQEQVASRAPQTTLPILSKGKWELIPLPLPPFEQQKRILARVEEVFRQCDELEARQQARRESRMRLTGAVLAPLNKAASLGPEEFEQATTRLADTFDTLYDSIDTISELRATILQLAVQGKLVPQDTCEQPAGALLESIRSRRLNDGENRPDRRKQTAADVINRLSFPLPKGWAVAPLGDVVSVTTGYAFKSPDYTQKGIFVLRVTNIEANGTINKSDPVYMPREKITSQISKYYLNQYDVLLVMVGGSLGKIGLVTSDLLPALLNQNMWRFKPHGFSHEFLMLLLKYINNNQLKITASTHGHLVMSDYLGQPIAFPPLAEQQRIVARVNQLVSLCDELEAKLRQAEADREKLMNAAVRHVLDSVRNVSRTREEGFA